jgi:hypothetical protein
MSAIFRGDFDFLLKNIFLTFLRHYFFRVIFKTQLIFYQSRAFINEFLKYMISKIADFNNKVSEILMACFVTKPVQKNAICSWLLSL